ncbi:glutamine synthetase/guanido kinase [Rhizopogon salebrosus TDB-379]|nr:glutamine synthetase/guanido kinase [Rhizopogon salebrosus TDB-379]
MANNPNHLPYSPQTTKALTIAPAWLEANDIHTVRITWVDLINNTRFRAVPLSSFQRLLTSSRPGVTVTQCVFGQAGIIVASGFSPVGEYLYVLDLTTIRLCSYAPGHASIVGWFQDTNPAPGRVLGTGVPMCPRSVLKRVIDTAASYNAAFLVGVESEFILLKNTNPIETVNAHGWSNSQALASGTKETEAMEDIAQGLIKSGIELMMYHSEGAPGQYEVVTGPLPPLEAADALVHTRETIVNMASKHGFRATFAPRLHLDNCGSAAHTHISVHPINPDQPFGLQSSAGDHTQAATSENVLTPLERIFLAGLMDHLPAACAFTLPIRASYARMLDGIWSGGTWVAWGRDNRETPVRLCVPPTRVPVPAPSQAQAAPVPKPPSGNHFEVKCVDGTSSPYLALSGLLGAGVLGIQSQSPLIEKDCRAPAATMTEAEREAVGVKRRLPRTWEEARGALEGDVAMRGLLGGVVEGFLAVGETLDGLLHSPPNEAGRIQMLVENY